MSFKDFSIDLTHLCHDSSIITISSRRSIKLTCIITMFIEIHVLNANSVDHDQMLRSAASGLGLHCLLMSLLWVKQSAVFKWVKQLAVFKGQYFRSHKRKKKSDVIKCFTCIKQAPVLSSYFLVFL